MGWFDDNDPMGSAAQEEMEAVFEETERRDADDLKKRTRTDPVPANAMPMKQIERPESEWDQSKWKPRTKKMTLIPKGRACVVHKNGQGYMVMKMYNKREVEYRAFEKYGGPTGFDAAWKVHCSRVKLPSPSKSPKKAKSSTSKAATLAKATIVGTSNGRNVDKL